MFLGYFFCLFVLLFSLVQLSMVGLLLRSWLARWPAIWWYIYKYAFLGLFFFALGSSYQWNYLGFLDLLGVFLAVAIFYQWSVLKIVLSFFLYFLGKFARFWWNKVKIYNYRYYFFSLNIVISEADLFWLEVYRDQLYPNDDRYYRIYRRWVFWMSPRPLEESKDYLYLFTLGYLARQFVIMMRLGFIYSRIYIQKMVANILGTTFCHILFFSLYFIFFYSLRKISYWAHKIGWLTYIFLLRQFQYLGSNYVNFHILDELNISWAQTEIPGNYDAFDEVVFGYPRDPSSFMVKFFEHFKTWDRIGEQNGLSFLLLTSFTRRYWKYFTSYIIVMPFILLYNLLGIAAFGLISVYGNFSSIPRFLARKALENKIALLELARFNSFFDLFLFFLKNIFYYMVLLPLSLINSYIYANFIKFFMFLLNGLFYNLVALLQFTSYLPALLFYTGRAFFRLLYRLRLFIFLVLLIAMFSDQQLYFMYIFSFGWVFNMIFAHLDSLYLFRPEEFLVLPVDIDRYVYRYIDSAIPTYPAEFFKTLYYYKIHVWRKISDVYRVRSAWYTMTKKWIYWLFFMKFMPFYGQTSMIEKWWFNLVYYHLLRTQLLFWWTFATYDVFYGSLCFLASFLKITIFLPYSFLQAFIYGVAGGSRTIYKSGYYIWVIVKFILVSLKNYLLWPLGALMGYILKALATALIYTWRTLSIWLTNLVVLFAKNFFKASWYYLVAVYLSLDDSFFWGSYRWLLLTIYGDILYYLPRVGLKDFLRITLLLEIAETYRLERLSELFGLFEEYILQWTNAYWPSQEKTRKMAVLVNPMFFFLACMLKAQTYLDILSINLQFPRDVQRNVYDYLVKKNLNFRFLRWVMPMRRTEMYSTARWYAPLMTYFSFIAETGYYFEGAYGVNDPLGFWILTEISEWAPAFFFGFIWNTIAIYYFLLALLVVSFPGFYALTFNQGPVGDHINREYNWYRFLNQEPKKLAWLFPEVSVANNYVEHVKLTNEMDTKIIYYEQLLARNIQFGPIKHSLYDLLEDSFVELDCGKEDFNFVIPEFLDFYVAKQYPNFRSAIHKGEERFTYFSALAYGRDEWIRTLWERTEDEDYNDLGPEVLFDQANLDEYISFFDKWHDIQRKTDAYLFDNNLASWVLSKDPYNLYIIRTSLREEFMNDKYAQNYGKLADEYEFEEDSDVTYIPWSLWGWLVAIPAMLFYQPFFFLGGSHWHYNRFSSGILHSFMLYFNAVWSHFEIVRLVGDIAGDTYSNVKREASLIGNHQMMQYRPTSAYGALRTSFYEFKLSQDSLFGEECQWFWGRLFYYRSEYLSLSALDSLRLVNILSFLFLVIFLPVLVVQRWSSNTPKLVDFFNLNNHVFIRKWFSLTGNLKKIYLWFYR